MSCFFIDWNLTWICKKEHYAMQFAIWFGKLGANSMPLLHCEYLHFLWKSIFKLWGILTSRIFRDVIYRTFQEFCLQARIWFFYRHLSKAFTHLKSCFYCKILNDCFKELLELTFLNIWFLMLLQKLRYSESKEPYFWHYRCIKS